MALFADLATLAEYLATEPSRLKKRAAIAAALRTTHVASPSTNNAGLLALYISGTPFAESDPRKLNAGGARRRRSRTRALCRSRTRHHRPTDPA